MLLAGLWGKYISPLNPLENRVDVAEMGSEELEEKHTMAASVMHE